MDRWVEIAFDCMPLRSVGRIDVPIDASPKYRERCEHVKRALEKHGALNAYYLYNAECTFHLMNHATSGMLRFEFEGTILTDESDLRAKSIDLTITLRRETCDWITEPIVAWFQETVRRAVAAEFDRYIAAGDLEKAKARAEALRAQADAQGGYLGMYL